MSGVSYPAARRFGAVLLAILLASGAFAPVALTGGAGAGGVVAGATGAGERVGAATTPADNDSVRHENPDEAGEDGDLGDVQGWLLERLSGRLGGSVINISQGQYEAAEGLLGERTREYLSEYVDVAGETESEEDDETAETINETITRQRNFTRTRGNYSELYGEYLEALENGNIERARRLLRELADLERRLNRTGRNLSRNYREIGNRTGIDFGEERRVINGTVRNVSETLAEAREDLFNETRIVIEEYTANASVLDPIVVRGRVVVANGTASAGNTTAVSVGEVVLGETDTRVTVNETGHFTLRHRPILLPRGGNNLTLEYLPPATSAYLASTDTFETTIEGREPTLTVNGTPEVVRFGSQVDLELGLTVANRSIEGVPIEATLGGVPLGSTTTENGTTTLSARVLAPVDDGARELRVAVPLDGQAVGGANVTRTIQVAETPTRLRVNATTVSRNRIRLRGQLATINGTPLSGRSVQVAIGGVTAGTVRTNLSGGLNSTVAIPAPINESASVNRTVLVAATFAAPETNLGTANASATITVLRDDSGGENTQSGLFGLGYPWWAWLALLALALAAGAGTYLVLSRLESSEPDEEGSGDAGDPVATVESESGGEGSTTTSLLGFATDRLDAGAADAATEASYEAVRRRLADRLGVAPGTHWEFYRACEENLPEDRVAAIRRLTEAYERAAFAPGSVPVETAREALAAAREALGEPAGAVDGRDAAPSDD